MPRKKAEQADDKKPVKAKNGTPGKTREIVETKYRDARGVRKQVYRRFKPGEDYELIQQNEMVAMYKLAKANVLSNNTGRPNTFETIRELKEAISEYWDYLIKSAENGNKLIPDVEGLASFLKISRETLNEWERSNYHGFSATIKSTKNDIASAKKQLALNGKIPPIVFATDFNNNHGYTQKQEMVITPNNPMGDEMSQEELMRRIEGSIVED